MWHKRLLSAEADHREWYWSNPDTGEIALETEWLIEPVTTVAKASYNQFDERANWKGELHHVGFVPQHVVEYEWRVNRRRMLADKEYVKHWLNQPENRAFRTRPGRI
jgi:hypothetical protein